MMNVIFISPNFPPGFHLFSERLRHHGAQVFGIGDTPPMALQPEVMSALTEYRFVPDLSLVDHVAHTIEPIIQRFGPIHRIESNNEYWLSLDAALRERFNVPGLRSADLCIGRAKAGMKKRFQDAGIPTAPFVPVTTLEALRKFADHVGYPIVLKPNIGVGAGGVFKVSSPEGLERAIRLVDRPYLAEPYVLGTIVTFDGLTDAHGNIVFCTSHTYCAGVMELVQERRPVWYWSLREIPEALEMLGRKVVAAFSVKERFFHIEFFEKPNGTYLAMEINLRSPGGFTTDMMNYACNIDLYDWWAQVILGKNVSTEYRRRYYVGHIGRRSTSDYVHSDTEIGSRLGPALCHFSRLPGALSGGMGDSAYIVRREALSELQADVHFIHESTGETTEQQPATYSYSPQAASSAI